MRREAEDISGILAYITMSEDRYLGGAPLCLLAKDKEELIDISNTIAEAFLADIIKLSNGDYMVIKN